MAGPFLSEIKYRGSASSDFAEVAVPTGTDVSNLTLVVYNPNGSVRSTSSMGSLDNTIGNKDIYVINTGIHKNGAVALVDNGTVLQFSSFDQVLTPTVGPAAGMTSTQIGTTSNTSTSLVSHDGGATYSTQSPPDAGTIPCFVAGTPIETSRGMVSVQDLMPDDMIRTLDHGYQPLRWAGSATVDLTQPRAHALRPIQVLSLGPTEPKLTAPLLLSPLHRLLWRSPLTGVLFGDTEVLVTARDLIDSGRARFVSGLKTVTYHHFALDRHEIVFASGQPVESLLCGADLLNSLPGASPGGFGHPAIDPDQRSTRPVLRQYEVQALMMA